jgi:phospholipase/carboxylesterase
MDERTTEIGGLATTLVGDPATAALTVVLLHGFAMEPADFTPFAHSLGIPGLFLFPRAPLDAFPEPGGAARGRSWWPSDPIVRARSLKLGPRDFVDEHPAGLLEARHALGQFVNAALTLTAGAGREPRPTVMGGFSQGGMVVCDWLLHEPRALAGLVLLSSSRIAYDQWKPLLTSGDAVRGLPVFASHGRADRDLAFAAGEGLRDCLSDAGADVTWQPFDGGHEVPLVVWRHLRKFLFGRARA